MFATLLAHEIRVRLRQLSTHVYFLIFFALGLLVMLATGGAFGSGSVSILGAGPNTNVNSPFFIGILTYLISFLGIVITSPFMGQAVYRDYDSGIHPLIFTTPISKTTYLSSRFLGAIVVHLYLYLGVTLGLMLATFTPWMEASRLGAFSLGAYLHPYLTFVIPNLLFAGSLFFALAALTRRMLPNYLGGVLLLMGYNIASILLSADAITNSSIASLLDPFGQIPASEITRYWTVAEQNSLVIPLEGVFLMNRLLWLGVGAAALAICFWTFEFAHLPGGSSSKADPDDAPRSLADISPTSLIRSVDVPRVPLATGLAAQWAQFRSLAWQSFLGIVRDVYFYAIGAASIIFLIIGASEAGKMYGTAVHPVTYHILDVLNDGFSLFMIILITFYAGQLVWRERDAGAQQLHDTLPMNSGIGLAAKFSALGTMCVVLLTVVGLTGIGAQLAYGFTDIDLGLYAVELYGVTLLSYLHFCVLAFTIHAVVNHKYIGHFIMVLYFVGLGFSGQLGLEHNLFKFGADPGMPFSDMNGYGHFPVAFGWYSLLWSFVAVLMATASRLFWVRGEEASLGIRLTQVQRRLSPQVLGVVGIVGVLMLGTGAYVYVNTTVWNTFRTSDAQEALVAEYEKTYERWSATPQPRITAVDFDVDLFPDRRDARFRGTYTLLNDHSVPVDSVYLDWQSDLKMHALDIALGYETAVDDSVRGIRIVRLDAPLAPGDSTTLTFDASWTTRGFTDGRGATALVDNGSFVNSGILPHIGYNEDAELSDRSTRREYGLDEEARMPPMTDSTARMRPYVSRDATWLRYEATVSTAANQMALAPGTLDSTWTSSTSEGERRHFRYRTTAPTLNFFSFLSAQYSVQDTTWTPADSSQNGGQPVGIEVYYHPEHDYNIDRMIRAVQHSLDYYTTHFGPYQSDQVRIAEFPRYASFAQSFLGTIPYSESIGFIARVDDETDIDYPYYVTAHELAHQWWAHQVISGPVQGGTMLVETLSQYSALMVMEERYGRDQMKRFLEYELDRYLQGRSSEQRQELPLMQVENQTYIHYRKGSLVMYALKDYLGEATVNRVLAEFIDDYKFQEPPFTTSGALVERFEAAAPDSLRGFVGDLFREITLYENRATEATYTETDDGRYRVDLTINARKLQADSLGTESPVAMDAYVDIGVFATDADVGSSEQQTLYLKKHRLTDGEQTVSVTVDEKPAQAGVDPYVVLIDRNTDDNLTDVVPAEE